jgi:hypothetical protein
METVQSIESLNQQDKAKTSRLSIQTNNDFTEFTNSEQ